MSLAAHGGLTLTTSSARSTFTVGRALGRAALPLPSDGLLLSLTGDLGSGKTVFVKGVAVGLGVPDSVPVVSPTFTMARSYAVPGRTDIVLHHVDAYRLRDARDLEGIGFEEMWGTGCVTCVEWGERVTEALALDRLDLRIDFAGEVAIAAPGDVPVGARRLGFLARGPASGEVLRRIEVCGDEGRIG